MSHLRHVLLFVVFILIVFGIIACGDSGTPATQATQAPTAIPTVALSPTATPKPAPTPPPTAVPKWTTVQTFTGNGIKKTGVFAVPDDWKILWTCDPASFSIPYNLIVTVYNSDGSIADLAINTLCKAGNVSGETEEHQAGNVYLDINSEGTWVIKVQVLK